MIWDLIQQKQIFDLQAKAFSSKFGAEQVAQQKVESFFSPFLERLDRISLVCQAMWTLIQDQTGLTEEDLLKRVTELDLKDGQADGKYRKPPVKCPKCGAMMSRKFSRCLFCGEKCTDSSAFDNI